MPDKPPPQVLGAPFLHHVSCPACNIEQVLVTDDEEPQPCPKCQAIMAEAMVRDLPQS
jgi:ribosomal protein S27E